MIFLTCLKGVLKSFLKSSNPQSHVGPPLTDQELPYGTVSASSEKDCPSK
jgi:hypothetical protein